MKKYLYSLLIPLTGLSLMLSAAAPVSAQTETASPLCYTFTKNLGEDRPISTQEATALAQDLSSAGVWSAGISITTYNDNVASAVSGFQQKYASQILTPNGLSYGTGFVGASTRAQLNSLYGCATPTQPSQSFQCPVGYTCAPINQNPVFTCPTGYTCTPSTVPTTPVIPVTTPTQPTNSSQSTIQIISPTNGQTVSQGSYLNIQWQHGTEKAGQNVTLYIRLVGHDSLSGGAYTQIVQYIVNGTNLSVASSIPSDGQWAWLVPSTVPAGQYEIQIIESLVGTAGLPTDIVFSNPFNITAAGTVASNPTCPSGLIWSGSMCTVQVQSTSGQPYVKIISPDGGETYSAGQVVPISFSTNLTSQQAPNGFNIWAYYGGNSTDVGSYGSGVQNIAMSYTGGTTYNWTVPSSLSAGNYVIYIVPATLASGISNTGLFAFGDSYFTINGQTTQTPTCSNDQTWNGSSCVSSNQASVSITAPNGGTYQAGPPITIQWTATGINSSNNSLGLAVYETSLGSTHSLISTTVGNTGSYTLTIPSTAPAGSDYVVYMNTSNTWTQSNPFTIQSAQSASVSVNLSAANPAVLAGDTQSSYIVPPGASRTFSFTLTPSNIQFIGTTQVISGNSVTLSASPGSLAGDTSSKFIIPPGASRTFTFIVNAGSSPVIVSTAQSLQ